jgi:hypothetical protein
MFKKLPKLSSISMVLILLATTPTLVLAAPAHQAETCALDYTVQADDWLSKIAEKQYGDPLAYPVIAEATNAAAQADGSYATIADPDLIEIGWKLCVPATAEGMMMAEGEMMAQAEAMMGETTKFNVRIENVGNFKFSSSGVFNTPIGASEPGPLVPGGTYESTFNAAPGDRLSFASMFVQSNDWFIAPDSAGIALFNEDGSPVTGDVTDQILLWDSGTEVNQEPGLGADQPLQQAGPNTGAADPDNTVRLVSDEFGNLPAVNELVKVTLDSPAPNQFVLRIENISAEDILTSSDGSNHPAPFAPGVWVVHTAENPLFTAGAPDFGQGLEALAEDGDPAALATALASETGLITPFAPGVWVIQTAVDPLFTVGQIDRGQGLEALAEDGDPAGLAEALANQSGVSQVGVFNTPAGADGAGPLLPGNAYEFTVEAVPGDNLSFATMFVQSNDLFYGPDGNGIALFEANGTPVTGDVTDQVALWDAGTEVNQIPGFGLDQAPRQSGPDTGADENGPAQIVSDGYTYPNTANTIRVTISPQ